MEAPDVPAGYLIKGMHNELSEIKQQDAGGKINEEAGIDPAEAFDGVLARGPGLFIQQEDVRRKGKDHHQYAFRS